MAGLTARLSTIMSASGLYLRAAKRFSDRAAILDKPKSLDEVGQEERDEIISELVHTSLAAVMVSNSAVEAIVNELFLESSLVGPGHWFKGISRDVSQSLTDAWNHGGERFEVILKCEIATALSGKKRLNLGGGSFQAMVGLIELRNALIHHKPVSVEHGKPAAESDDAVERKVARLFPTSQVCGASYAWRWHGCLGAGCAKWAYETAVRFERDFFAHLGIEYPK